MKYFSRARAYNTCRDLYLYIIIKTKFEPRKLGVLFSILGVSPKTAIIPYIQSLFLFSKKIYRPVLSFAVLLFFSFSIEGQSITQNAVSWSVGNNANWTPPPPNANPLGAFNNNCTGGIGTGSYAEFSFFRICDTSRQYSARDRSKSKTQNQHCCYHSAKI